MKKRVGYAVLLVVIWLSYLVYSDIVSVIGVMDVGNFDEFAIIKGLIVLFVLHLLSKIGFEIIRGSEKW